MASPILDFDLMRGSRSSGLVLLRRICTGWLVLQFLFLYWLYLINSNLVAHYVMKEAIEPAAAVAFVNSATSTLIVQQFILLALCTPALTAGAITDEKTRGTLQYLLTADVTGREIIVGKLFGRVWQILILSLTSLPMICFLVGLGGYHPIAIAVPYLLVLVPVFAIASASMLASVWCRQTRDAVLVVYFGLFVAAGLVAATGLESYFNPMHVLESAWDEEVNMVDLGRRAAVCTATWLCFGLLFLGLASWRLRGAYLRQLENEGAIKKARWWRARRRPVSDDPLRWKESQVEGVAPLLILRRVPRWLGVVVTAAATVFSSLSILGAHLKSMHTSDVLALLAKFDFAEVIGDLEPASNEFQRQGVVAMFIATLLMGLRCSGAITGERERQTWEALLLTPLSVKQLLRSKLWGIIAASYPYLAAYAVPALLLSMLGGPVAFIWTAVLLGVSWMGMAYAGAAGLWCSSRSSSSWRSLLATVGLGYAAGFLVYGFAWMIVPIIFLAILLLLLAIDHFYLGGQGGLVDMWAESFSPFLMLSYVALACFFIGLTWFFLAGAQRYIANRERMRIWKKDEGEVYQTVKAATLEALSSYGDVVPVAESRRQ
jgi:ABC-type transport system involved in multi-copper enzyme maturation permease subunit